jgi:microcystin-dependent protein
MGTPFIGEIKMISWNFAPQGWTFCNGQQLPINQNQALFSILGTTYGGDGRVTFALPDLRGRTPLHVGNGIILGESGGAPSATITISTMPAHNHVPSANSGAGNTNTPDPTVAPTGNRVLSQSDGSTGSPAQPFGVNIYSNQQSPNASLAPTSVTNVGGSQPHENMSPYLTLNFIIALQGVFPSRN